jgi:selenocysteine-specific elongation factor
LVDCPGHAGLIKTIIGGAQIIDMMLLVIDIVKGIQTQTAECLIIGEICCDKMLIVLNKLDLIEESKRESVIDKMSKRLLKTLENTKFANSPIVAVSANRQQTVDDSISNLNLQEEENNSTSKMLNMNTLIDTLKLCTFLPSRRTDSGPFLFFVDHCFSIKGQGTIMTGTVISGQVKVNESIEIPAFKEQKKVKSIQIFRKPVEKAQQGDRCGICLANVDAKQFERGIIAEPNYVKNAFAVIVSLNRIKHFKTNIENGSKFHITIGHETLIGKIDLFGLANTDKKVKGNNSEDLFDFNQEYTYINELDSNQIDTKIEKYFALIDFTHENNSDGVLCVLNSLLIGSKLDTDIHLNQCRIAFHGRVLYSFTNKDFKESTDKTTINLSKLKVYKIKQKEGCVERKHDDFTLIGRSLFKKETNMDLFNGLKVKLSTGEDGVIESGFGQSGKFKVRIMAGLLPTTLEQLESTVKTKKKTTETQNTVTPLEPIKIFLNLKKFIYCEDKKKIFQ